MALRQRRRRIVAPNLMRAQVVKMSGPPVTPQAETAAIIAAMTVQPDQPRRNLIDQTVVNLKNAGLWATFDFFFAMAAHDQQAARVNWINPAGIASVNGSPTFTVDGGFTGNGVDGWLGSGLFLNALVKFTQNNCSIGVYVPANTQGPPLIGTTTAGRITITPRTPVDIISTRLMNGTQSTATNFDARGHTMANRAAAAGYDRYRNGALFDSVVVASVAAVAEEVVFLRQGNTYSNNHILSIAHGGSSLTPAQIASLNSILYTYMVGVGRG